MSKVNLQKHIRKGRTTHGHAKTGKVSPEYKSWTMMLSRCNNIKSHNYKDYGGRGISVCDRWEKSFENFLEDMGDRQDGMSIDRVDNSLGYFKENCRWATRFEQHRNKRNNRLLEINGVTKCVSEWAEEVGLNNQTIHERLNRGWAPEDAVFKKVRRRSKVS
jgi:hypothetical protein